MNNINTASLLLAVLAIIVSIAAFVLDGNPNGDPRTRRWKIALGILFFFLAVLLGAYGIAGFVVSPPTIPVVTLTNAAATVVATAATATTAPTVESTPTVTTASTEIPTPPPMPTDTPTVEPTATVPPTNTPILLTPTLTPTPVVVAISVPGNADDGVNVTIPAAGVYYLVYSGGAYSPWPTDNYAGNRGWATHVQAFVNRPINWGMTAFGLLGPVNFDGYIGAEGYYGSAVDAAAATQGKRVGLGFLNVGDTVTLITVDEQGRYGDNRDSVEVQLIGYPQ